MGRRKLYKLFIKVLRGERSGFVCRLLIVCSVRLGLDWIDRYLIHSPIGGKIVESWDAMVELQKQKLVRSIGVSNFSQQHLEELKKARPDNIPVGKVKL